MTRDHVALAAQYQADVLAGVVPAGKWVRLACERNRRDLDRQESEAFPYRFDPERARRICQFAELLPHIKGPKAVITGTDELGRSVWNTLALEPWQCWMFTTLFGWVHVDTGLRRFRVGLVLVPRKNGKSVLGAIIALFLFAVEGGSGAEVYSAATTREQATIVAEIAWEMASRSPQFREHFGIRLGSRTTRSLSIPTTAAKFAPLSADAQSLDGLNVLCAIVDELHAHKTRAVWDVIDTATGAQLEPLLLAITTAGVEIGGICHEKLGLLEKVLDGVAADETFFGINFTIDSVPHVERRDCTIALKSLEDLCDCERVSTIQIERYFREACARTATTDGIENLEASAVQNIQAEKSKPGGCAAPAIASGASSKTQHSENISDDKAPHAALNGRGGIERSSKPPMRGTDRLLKTEKKSSFSTDSRSTASPENNSSDCALNRTIGVRSASDTSDVYTWITATVRERFGDCFASDVTARSVFSETLKKVYDAHSPTCSARTKSKLHNESAALDIDSPGDDIRDPVIQQKANPNYAVSVQPDDLARKVAAAQHSPAALNNVLTKHFNVWIRTEAAWMTATAWQARHVEGVSLETLRDAPCYIGIDLGETRDPSALALTFKLPDGVFAVVPRIYMPAETIARSPVAQLSGWVREGWIIETPGSEADYTRIREDLLGFFGTLQVVEIDFDRRSARLMMQEVRASLESKLGRDRVEQVVLDIPQNVDTMDPAMKMTETLVLGEKLQHDGSPVMAWMISNVVVERNHKGEIYPRKAGGKDSWNKIDGAVAFFTALSRARLAPEPEKPYQFFTIGGRR